MPPAQTPCPVPAGCLPSWCGGVCRLGSTAVVAGAFSSDAGRTSKVAAESCVDRDRAYRVVAAEMLEREAKRADRIPTCLLSRRRNAPHFAICMMALGKGFHVHLRQTARQLAEASAGHGSDGPKGPASNLRDLLL